MGNVSIAKIRSHGSSDSEESKDFNEQQVLSIVASTPERLGKHYHQDQVNLRSMSNEERLVEEELLDEVPSEQLMRQAHHDFHTGNNYFREAQYERAKDCYLSALKRLEHCDADWRQHHEAMLLTNKGVLQFAQGRYLEARSLLESSLIKHRATIKAIELNDLDEISLSSLSLNIKQDIASGICSKSEQALVRSIKCHGNIDAMVSDVLNNLAACHEVLGQLQDAEQFYYESLELRQLVFGRESLKAAESMQNLATILDTQGKYHEAEKLLSGVLMIQRNSLGDDHVDIAVTLNNLGVLLTHLGKFHRAQMLLEESVRIRSSVYGLQHHLTHCSRQNLEFVSHKKKKMELLEQDLQSALSSQRLELRDSELQDVLSDSNVGDITPCRAHHKK